MTEQLLDEPETARKHRIFLSVLCILTWIGCTGVVAVNLLIAYELSNRMWGFYPEYDAEQRKLIWCSISFMFLALISLVGSVLMWKLRRVGFYLYLVAQAVSLSLLLYLFLQSRIRIDRLYFFDVVALLGVFGLPLLFIGLFALNLKHLRR